MWERQWRGNRGLGWAGGSTDPQRTRLGWDRGSTDPQRTRLGWAGGTMDPQRAQPGIPHGPAVAPRQRLQKALMAEGRPRMALRPPLGSSENRGGAEQVRASGRQSGPPGRWRAELRAPGHCGGAALCLTAEHTTKLPREKGCGGHRQCAVSSSEQPERMRSGPAVQGQGLALQTLHTYYLGFPNSVRVSTYILQLFAVTNRFSAACEELQQSAGISWRSQLRRCGSPWSMATHLVHYLCGKGQALRRLESAVLGTALTM